MSVSRILATYRIAASAADIESRARSLAVEQSVEMPLEAIRDARVRDEVVATVEKILPSPARGSGAGGEGAFEVTLGLAAGTPGHEASQLANMLFGNCSLQPEVELLDVAFPPGYARSFPGPEFGIAGLRASRANSPRKTSTPRSRSRWKRRRRNPRARRPGRPSAPRWCGWRATAW